MPTLRLVSTDARSFAGDRAALTAAIGALTPDIAVVHGAPHLGRWRSLSAQMARNCGLVVVGGGRVGGANLIMSSLGVDVVGVHDVLFSHNPARPTGVSVARLRRTGARFAIAAGSFGAASPGTDAALLRHALGDAVDMPLALSVVGGASLLDDLGQVVANRLVLTPSLQLRSTDEADPSVLVADLFVPDA